MSRDYIFLSYSHKDIQKIQSMVDWLENHYHVWYDKNLGLAREYNEEIADRIRNAEIVIAFFSASYMESPYCRDEIMYARTKGVEILGILMEDVQMSEGMQLRLGRFQMLNFSGSAEYEKVTQNENVQKCLKSAKSESLLESLQHSNKELAETQLPRMVFATDFVKQNWEKGNLGSLHVSIGLRQDAQSGEIAEAYYDTDYGHQCVYGNIMSGKSTLLQTVAMQLMDNYSPQAVQFYMIDFGNYMLEVFRHAPHVGDIVNREDKEKIDRLLLFIEKELRERIAFFRNGSYATYAQKYGMEKPFIILMIDGFECFTSEYLTSVEKEDSFKNILRNGMRAGILFLLSSGTTRRVGMRGIAENIRPLAALGYENVERYDEVFGEYSNLKEIGKKDTFEAPGRGIIKAGRKLFLLQTALPIGEAEDYDRYDALAKRCRELAESWDGECAPRIPCVPEDFSSDYFFSLPEVQHIVKASGLLTMGLNLNTACPESISLENHFIYLVMGKNAAERSNLLRLFMKQIVQKHWKCTVIDSKNVHHAFAADMEIQHVATDLELYTVCLELLSEIRDRRAKGPENFEPHFILIDDLDTFYSLLRQDFSKEKNIGSFLRNIMEKGMNCGVYFMITANPDKRSYEAQEPVAGMTRIISDNCNGGLCLGGNITGNRWFEIDYSSAKKFAYDVEAAHGKGAALMVTKNGVDQKGIVKVPQVL